MTSTSRDLIGSRLHGEGRGESASSLVLIIITITLIILGAIAVLPAYLFVGARADAAALTKSEKATLARVAEHAEALHFDSVSMVPGKTPVFYRGGTAHEANVSARASKFWITRSGSAPRFREVDPESLTEYGKVRATSTCENSSTGSIHYLVCPSPSAASGVVLRLKWERQAAETTSVCRSSALGTVILFGLLHMMGLLSLNLS
jgi:hypothetical protein